MLMMRVIYGVSDSDSNDSEMRDAISDLDSEEDVEFKDAEVNGGVISDNTPSDSAADLLHSLLTGENSKAALSRKIESSRRATIGKLHTNSPKAFHL